MSVVLEKQQHAIVGALHEASGLGANPHQNGTVCDNSGNNDASVLLPLLGRG